MAFSANLYFCERYFQFKSHSKTQYRVDSGDPWASQRHEELGEKPHTALRQWTNEYIAQHPDCKYAEAKKLYDALPEDERTALEEERAKKMEEYTKREAEWMVKKMRDMTKRVRANKKADAVVVDERATKKGKTDSGSNNNNNNNKEKDNKKKK